MEVRHGSLFSGIGGFDLAAQWMGWENVFQVEIDPFCQKVLEKNFPKVKRYGDIKEFDGTRYRGSVDVLSGGFPCQPYSNAGRRKGKEDDRHLWPEMLRVIREIQPAYIVGENVLGLINWSRGLVFEEVQADLETEGYEVQSFLLPAAGVQAPHQRYRAWIVAHSRGVLRESLSDFRGRCDNEQIKEGRQVRNQFASTLSSRVATNTNSQRIQGGGKTGNIEIEKQEAEQHIRGYDKPYYWNEFPTQSPICNRDDGVPSWLVRSGTEAGGNAIVPQVAYEIFKAIEQTF